MSNADNQAAPPLVGSSAATRALDDDITAASRSDAKVLITGESGVGKDVAARLIHSRGSRVREALVTINCAGLPDSLLETELFGHVKGSFTDAHRDRPGLLQVANRGTIFLDEVAEMPSDVQVKLLRAIETRCIRRLGGKKEIDVDIRILAATNRDLQKALSENELREDLYYRLAVVELFLPPLRERIGDIKLLANEFLARFGQQNGKTLTGFDDAAWDWIISYNWPGNVRELKNAVERAVIMGHGDTIKAADIMPRHLRRGSETPATITLQPGATLAETRRQLVLRAFASTNGDYNRTATIVGMSPAEVRAEIASLLNGNGTPAKAPAKAAAAPAKSKSKKR
jgi:two-component system response regulator HydG